MEMLAMVVCVAMCAIAVLQVPIAMQNKKSERHVYIHHIHDNKK